MYKVIQHFTDLQDGSYAYEEGDVYPREGYTSSLERITELSTSANRRGIALIKEVKEAEAAAALTSEKSSDVVADNTASMESETQKRNRRRKNDAETE